MSNIENNNQQSRWKSPVAITSLLMLVFFIVKNWVGFEIPNFDEFVTLVIATGIGFGILNSPTAKKHF